MRFPKPNQSRQAIQRPHPEQKHGTVRAFFAVDFDDAVKRYLSEAQDVLRPLFADYRVNWVRPEQMHMTLRFLGDVTPAQVTELIDACEFIRSFKPFHLELSGPGCFPSRENPRVVWIGCQCPDELFLLQERIERAVQAAGLTPETKRFSPHLTLGRIKDSHQRSGKSGRTDWTAVERFFDTPPDKIIQTVRYARLYQSRLSAQGASYSVLHDFHFSS